MVAVSTADLVSLYLANFSHHPGVEEDQTAPYGCSVPGISDALDSDGSDSDLALLSVLSELVDDGYVTESVTPVEGLDGERTVYSLTEDGREHARELRTSVASEWITIRRDGGDRRIQLSEATDHVDVDEHFSVSDPLVGALVSLDEDDRLVLETTRAGERFVNRHDELALFERALWSDAPEQRPGVHEAGDPSAAHSRGHKDGAPPTGIVVRGPTGTGKTSLVTEFARVIRDEEGTVLSGSAGPGAGEPYGPIRSALMGGGAFDAAALFSEFEAGEVDADSFEAQRRSLFVEVTEAIEAFVGDDPTLVFLDDLQWADPATLELVAFLFEHLSAPNTVLITAYNTELTDPDDALAATVEEATAAGHATAVDLGPLSPTHLESMIEWYLDTETVPEEFVSALHRRTGGNPLFVAESVRHLEDEGIVDPGTEEYPTDPDTIALPETVEKVLATRLSRLATEQLTLLQRAAVIGEHVPLSVLAGVTDQAEASLQDVASAFVDADLWEVDPAAERTLDRGFRFGSAAIRDTVLDTMQAAERRDCHGTVANVLLEERDQDEHGRHARVAYHYEAAEQVADAIDHYRKAADYAIDVYAHDSALESLDQAFSLATDSGDRESAVELALELARVRTVVGQYEQATEHAEYVREHTADVEQEQLALLRLSEIAEATGQLERAVSLAEDGLSATPNIESTMVCRLLHAKCKAEWRQGSYDSALETARRQHGLAESLDDPDQIADALHDLGTIRLQQGAYDMAQERFQSELSIRRDRGDRHGVAGLLNNLGIVAYRKIDLETAREYHEEALESYREIGSRYDVAACLVNLGLVLKGLDEYEEGRAVLEESLSTFRDLGNDPGVSATLTNLGLLAYKQGDLASAHEYHEEGLAMARNSENRHHVAENLDGLGLVAHERDEHDRAREFFEESLEIKRELGITTNVADTLRSLGEIAIDLEEYDTARGHLQEAEEIAREVGNSPLTATVQVLVALVAVETDEIEAADDWCTRALETLSEALDAEEESIEAVEWFDELTRAALEAGYDDLAEQWWTAALETFEELGVETDADREQFEGLRTPATQDQ